MWPGIFGTILYVSCITTTNPKEVNIVVLDAPIITLPYDTYQAIREAAGLPDIICE